LFYGSILHGAEAPRKNVLVILSDDQGFCELGSYIDFAAADNLGSHLAEKYRSIKTSAENQAPIEVCFEAARKCMPRVDAIAKEGGPAGSCRGPRF